MYPYVHCNIFHGDEDMEATEASFDRWLDEEDTVHIYNGILLGNNDTKPRFSCLLMQKPMFENGCWSEEKMVYSRASSSRSWWGGSHPKDHLNILEQAKGFIRRERENRTKRLIEEGWNVFYVQTCKVYSDKDLETCQGMVWCVTSWFYSSWL